MLGGWCRHKGLRNAALPPWHEQQQVSGLLQTLLHFVLRRDLPLLLRPAAAAGSNCSRRRRVRGSVALLELAGMSVGAFNSQTPQKLLELLEYQWLEGEFDKQTSSDPTQSFRRVYD